MTIVLSDTEIISRRLAALTKDGRKYIETHRRLSEEVAERTTLDLRKKDKADAS